MKTTVELNKLELTQALRDYLKKRGVEAKSAAITGNTENVTLEVNGAGPTPEQTERVAVPPKQVKPVATSHRPKNKHKRQNAGIFSALKGYFASAKNLGIHEVTFADLKQVLTPRFPALQEDRLVLYLYDRRQLPNVAFSAADKVIRLGNDLHDVTPQKLPDSSRSQVERSVERKQPTRSEDKAQLSREIAVQVDH